MRCYSTENDWPQPQVDVAFGFLMVKPPPVTVSTKSTSAPFRYRMLIGSMNSLTPCDSNTWSAEPWPFSSIMSPYWKPEQPPPCTNTRRPLPALFSSVSSSLIFAAAVSDTLIIERLSSESPTIITITPLIYCLMPQQFAVFVAWERTQQTLEVRNPFDRSTIRVTWLAGDAQ